MLEAHYEGRIKINGDGNQSRSFIYINRVTEFLEKLLESNLSSSYFNLVDRNMSVLDIVEAIKEIYPATEMIFVNHHMKMKELKVKADEQTKTLLEENPMTLVEELQEFKKMFTF
jgi:UDP-glucose 4-epimerase